MRRLASCKIVPEQRRDQWAALLHRPAARGVIFLGKAIAGLTLCLMATALPLLASICYVAAPGNFPAPLAPGMILPGLSDLLLGPVFYFAAVLACLERQMVWAQKGSIPLAAVAVIAFHLGSVNSFAVMPVVAGIILGIAAWGALAGNGRVAAMPRLARICRLLVVLTGSRSR